MGKSGESGPDPPQLVASHWASPYNPLDPKAPKLPTKGAIKAVIPKECFERSYLKGLAWIMCDVGLVALLAFTSKTFLSTTAPSIYFSCGGLTWLLGWSVYAWCMGSTMAGCWVLAHECGHGALFPSKKWNDAFGFVIHQLLLCPYYPWRYTHSKHHQFTNHLKRDTTYVPETLSELGLLSLLPASTAATTTATSMSTTNTASSQSGACRASSPLLSAALKTLGNGPVAMFNLIFYHLVGWPLYIAGVSLVVTRTNHDGDQTKEST